MITLRTGSHALNIITLLSVTGEFPMRSLKLLGNERVLKALVHKMTTPQDYRLPHTQTEERITCKLLNVSGKGSSKSIRFSKAALPILEWIHPDAYDYYMHSFWDHKFPGDAAHIERNHRVAESVMMCMAAGIECRPYSLPSLQNMQISLTVPEYSAYYLAKDLKKLGDSEMSKTVFTRMAGAIFSQSEAYAVYNTRNALMKWNGMGEFKALHNLIEISRMNAGVQNIQSAILLGESEEIAFKTLMETEKNRRLEFRFDSIYQNIYFVPMNDFGIKLLRLLSIPGWKTKLLDLLFDKETQSGGQGMVEYDAFIDNKYIDGFVNEYELDLTHLKVLHLSEYSILHWLALLMVNRRFRISTPVMRRGFQWLKDNFLIDITGYDVIIGYRADDSYFSFARAFINNEISLTQLSYAMKLGKLGEQIVLKSPKAFEEIRFLSYSVVDNTEYYAKRKSRDEEARAAFRAELDKEDINGLYMRDILREEVKKDDPRLQ